MTFVPHSTVLPRVLWRPAMFFFALAQLVLAFAPIADARESRDARAHVENAGVALHHAHNDANCIACIARELLSSSELAAPSRPGIVSVAFSIPSTAPLAVTTRQAIRTQSRAPPLNRA